MYYVKKNDLFKIINIIRFKNNQQPIRRHKLSKKTFILLDFSALNHSNSAYLQHIINFFFFTRAFDRDKLLNRSVTGKF